MRFRDSIILTIGISIGVISMIPILSYGQTSIVERLLGRIVLRVHHAGEAWYINPVDGLRYYLGGPEEAFNLLREHGLGISDEDLFTIPKAPGHYDEIDGLDRTPEQPATPATQQHVLEQPTEDETLLSWGIKYVDETVTDADLAWFRDHNITILSGEWGMDALGPSGLVSFLDRLDMYNLKYVVNFADDAAWGYSDTYSQEQQPVWQGDRVAEYIKAVKGHPAVYAYDISNEGGENLPNGDRYRVTVADLKQARDTVRKHDVATPILLRMHYWDTYDGTFAWSNPFADGIADIVMLNIYSNFTEDGDTVWNKNLVSEAGQRMIDEVLRVDADARIWIALASFKQSGIFLKPSADDLKRDIEAALEFTSVENIGFFGWGQRKAIDSGYDWYLPQDGADLLEVIGQYTLR